MSQPLVLVVEDDVHIRDLVVLHLELEGFLRGLCRGRPPGAPAVRRAAVRTRTRDRRG
jgi:DNA-binding response OmpR family regulator